MSGLARREIVYLTLIGLIGALPPLTANVGGDVLYHLVLMDCFGSQFWSGDLYPRWCFSANSGQGSPALLLYFPLPYYISSLFYPLTWTGIDIYRVFQLSLLASCMVSAVTVFWWIKPATNANIALLASLLYLLMPYHQEIMLFRAAYAEAWCVALLPLMAYYARWLASLPQPRVAAARLSIVTALAILCHVPTTVVGAFVCGIYVLAKSFSLKRMAFFAVSMLGAVVMTGFFIAANAYFQRFVTYEMIKENGRGWPNEFITLDNLLVQGRLAVVGYYIMAALLPVLMLVCWRKRKALCDFGHEKEWQAWLIAAGAAAFMTVPLSAPVWDIMNAVAVITFPWRMQAGTLLGITAVAAMLMHIAAKRKTWKMDAALLTGLLLLCSQLILTELSISKKFYMGIMESHAIRQTEYCPRWMSRAVCIRYDYYTTPEAFLNAAQEDETVPEAERTKGRGEFSVEKWDAKQLHLKVHAASQMELRLRQAYFPIWILSAEASQRRVVLNPEAESGRMMLTVPAGFEGDIIIERNAFAAAPWLYWMSVLSFICSIAALAIAYPPRK